MKLRHLAGSGLALLQLVAGTFSAALAAPLFAQLPEHHAVVGTISSPAAIAMYSGTTGVFFVPLPTAAPVPQIPILVTGLPSALTVPSGPNTFGGAFSVLHRPSDGKLFVGDGAAASGTVHVHVLNLVGTAVQGSSVSVTVGTVASGADQAVSGLALFPDGRVLVTSANTASFVPGSGPGAISPLGILSTAGPTPVLTPVPLSGIVGSTIGAAVSPDGRSAYVTTFQNNGGYPPCRLYRVNVDQPGWLEQRSGVGGRRQRRTGAPGSGSRPPRITGLTGPGRQARVGATAASYSIPK